jgi:hypothetical protein
MEYDHGLRLEKKDIGQNCWMLCFRKASMEILFKDFFKISLQAKLLSLPTTQQLWVHHCGGDYRLKSCPFKLKNLQ